MIIKEIEGEALRYHVQSSSGHGVYVVDLAENEGSGACACVDFIVRRQPAIDAGEELFTRKTSCRHILAVRKRFLKRTLTEMSRIIKKGGR